MVAVDTAGNKGVIKKGVEFAPNLGQFIILGIPP